VFIRLERPTTSSATTTASFFDSCFDGGCPLIHLSIRADRSFDRKWDVIAGGPVAPCGLQQIVAESPIVEPVFIGFSGARLKTVPIDGVLAPSKSNFCHGSARYGFGEFFSVQTTNSERARYDENFPNALKVGAYRMTQTTEIRPVTISPRDGRAEVSNDIGL
jgi:hypothetical protein